MRMFDQLPGKMIRSMPRHVFAMAAAVLAIAHCPGTASARDAFADDAYATYKANVDNGKYLFNAAGCGACHGSGSNTELLSGGMEMDTAIGKFYAPNISPHTNGIGGWSNAQFLNAVMQESTVTATISIRSCPIRPMVA